MKQGYYLALIIIIIVIIGIAILYPKGSIVYAQKDDSAATTEGVNAVVDANNRFAIDLYVKYKDDLKYKDKNIFFSPYSIFTALAMTYEGAAGQTADEIQTVFHFPVDNITRRSANARLYNTINVGDKKYTLRTANALWAQQDYVFLQDYFDVIENYYDGKITNMDFVGDAEGSRATINKWVEDQTNSKIKDLIPSGTINSMTRLVLTNAIYFKGDWILQFDKSKTQEADFKINTEKTVKAQMMSLTGEKAIFNYTENDIMQMIELPYAGNEISMLILLPKENINVIEQLLSAEKINEWRSSLKQRKIDVYMPKFKFETKYFMADDLKAMGMLSAFDQNAADFSGMTGKRDLYISGVIHQAYIDVNEEGTEAAAATAVLTEQTSAGPMNEFRADHPFIFIIQQKQTGNILFIGKVNDPTAK
jgi:serpin B